MCIGLRNQWQPNCLFSSLFTITASLWGESTNCWIPPPPSSLFTITASLWGESTNCWIPPPPVAYSPLLPLCEENPPTAGSPPPPPPPPPPTHTHTHTHTHKRTVMLKMSPYNYAIKQRVHLPQWTHCFGRWWRVFLWLFGTWNFLCDTTIKSWCWWHNSLVKTREPC